MRTAFSWLLAGTAVWFWIAAVSKAAGQQCCMVQARCQRPVSYIRKDTCNFSNQIRDSRKYRPCGKNTRRGSVAVRSVAQEPDGGQWYGCSLNCENRHELLVSSQQNQMHGYAYEYEKLENVM